ncbi:MAG: hypothetical protein V1767_00935 [Chloroflexota bacterium]
MPTARTAALAVANIVTLVTVPVNKKLVLDSVIIDNQGAAGHTIHLRDDFTPDASNGTPVPAGQTIEKAQWTVGTLLTASIPKNELETKEFLGTLRCYADGAEALCIITCDYHFE